MNQLAPCLAPRTRSPARSNLGAASSSALKDMRESTYDTTGKALRCPAQDGAAAPASAAGRTRAPDIGVGDWDMLFEAIQTRLKQALGVWLDVTLQTPSPEALKQAGSMALECSAAMDLLHAALTQERSLSKRPQAHWVSGAQRLQRSPSPQAHAGKVN